MAGPTHSSPGRIFVSYRREETAYPAGWLYARLADRFGSSQVFKDVDSIQLGDDFVEVITTAVGSCDVLLALIGEEWLTISDELGRRRLDDPDDFIRLEIEAALKRNVRVIPILVDGATMPRADLLPESLGGLVRRQALELSPSRFEFDTSRLFRVLDWTLAEVRTGQDEAPEALAGAPPGPADADVAGSDEAVVREGSVRGGSGEAEQSRTRPPVAAGSASPGAPAVAAPPPGGGVQAAGHGPRRPRRVGLLVGSAVGVVALLLAAVLAYAQLTSNDDPAQVARGSGETQAIEVDSSPVTSVDGIRLTGLRADARHSPPHVGDTVTVSYSLTNVTDRDIQLGYTFVGVRDAADENLDTEDMNENTVLSPGQTVQAEGRRLLSAPGEWTFWPCYQLPGDQLCPDEWQAFFFLAE